MPKRTRKYDEWLLQELADPVTAANYVNAAIEDSPSMLLVAIRNIAEARKVAAVAKEAGVNRETLYRTLSKRGNPTLDTLNSVLDAIGLVLKVEPKTGVACGTSGTVHNIAFEAGMAAAEGFTPAVGTGKFVSTTASDQMDIFALTLTPSNRSFNLVVPGAIIQQAEQQMRGYLQAIQGDANGEI